MSDLSSVWFVPDDAEDGVLRRTSRDRDSSPAARVRRAEAFRITLEAIGVGPRPSSDGLSVVVSSTVAVDGEDRPARVHAWGDIDKQRGIVTRFYSDVVYLCSDYLGSCISISTHVHSDHTPRDEHTTTAIDSVLAQVGAIYPAAIPFTTATRGLGAVARRFLELSRPTAETRIAAIDFVPADSMQQGTPLAPGRFVAFGEAIDDPEASWLAADGSLGGGLSDHELPYVVLRVEPVSRVSVARGVRQLAADSTALVLEQVSDQNRSKTELPLVGIVELAQAAHYFGAVQRYRQLLSKQRTSGLSSSEELLRERMEDDPVIRNVFGLDYPRSVSRSVAPN